MDTNPLLDFSGLPRFDAIAPEHVAPAMRQLLDDYRGLIDHLLADPAPPTWDDFAQPMIDAGERVSRAWGVVGHLHSVNDVPAWRDAYNALLPEVSRFFAEIGQNLLLAKRYKDLHDGPQYAALSPARRRILDNELRDFRLAGAELPESDKPRFKAIQEELSALAAKFSENLLDATNAHAEWIDEAGQLDGLPEDVVAAARSAAEVEGRSGWKFTLQAPSYVPVMQYAEHRPLRERLYRAYVTRASEFGPAELDNGGLIERILALRAEEAALLGYASYAEVSLASKMADNPAQVIAFLRDMAAKARPHAERDLSELRAFAGEHLGMNELAAWDIAWAAEKLKLARYAFSDDEVKQYFPEDKVLAGLFGLVERLFAVRLLADSTSTWDADVRFFTVEREGRPVGRVYFDLHARATKRGGAWMDDAMARRRTAAGLQLPVAYLTCNFPAAVEVDGRLRPATFSHDDVITLFHECGHGLHHLLTEVEDLPVSGIHGVEWDAVELPSQFMENFCWEWEVLRGMSAHVESGEPLPRALFDKMLAAKNFQSGLQTLKQIEFSLFDMRLHSDYRPASEGGVQKLLDAVRDDVAVLRPPTWNRFANSFSHIFAGGYAAGYYSYKWAEVLSADAFEAFEEAARASAGNTLDAATGRRFLAEILAVGGARPAMESFRAFRGRAPRPDALLRHSGMAVAPQ